MSTTTKLHCMQAIESIKGMMIVTAVWPREDASIFYIVRERVCSSLTILFYISMCLEALVHYEDFQSLSEVLCVLFECTPYMGKYIGFMINRRVFVKLLNDFDNDQFNNHPENLTVPLRNTIKRINIISRLFRILSFCSVLFYLLFPILDGKKLPIPFSFNVGRYTYLMYIFQIVSLGLSAWNNSCFDLLCSGAMGIASAQLEMLSGRLTGLYHEVEQFYENLSRDGKGRAALIDEKIHDILKICVRHHLSIIRLVERIERVFSFGVLVQILGSIVEICFIVLVMALMVTPGSSQFFLQVVYILTVVTQLGMYCWFGNELIIHSTLVGQACYMSEWYEYDTSAKKILFLMMERSKRPLCITAYKFTSVSLESFVAVIRWSYSAFALLQRVYAKN